MDLKGKHIVVTGISKGIGKALALLLLEKGAYVHGWGMTKPEYTHENLFFIETDVRMIESVEDAFKGTLEQSSGRVDVLINNAGLGYFGYFEEMPVEHWHRMFETNVNGIFYVSRKIIPIMKKQQSGHIINISSIAGLEAMPQVAAYCATKHAVKAITDALFRELRDYGIKVSGIYPGSTQTAFFDNADGMNAHENMMQAEEVASTIVQTLSTSGNYLVNQIVMRPLQPKGPPKKS